MADDFQPIRPYSAEAREVDHSQIGKIRELLLGRSIERIVDNHLVLDTGAVVRIEPNSGGCVCGAGDYSLTHLDTHLAGSPNIITAVTIEEVGIPDPDFPDNSYSTWFAYRVFVVAAEKRVNLFTVEGDDGNGYYGTGFQLWVRDPSNPEL